MPDGRKRQIGISRRSLVLSAAAAAALSSIALQRLHASTGPYRRRSREPLVVNLLGDLRNPNGARGAQRIVDERALRDLRASRMAAVSITVAPPTAPFEEIVGQFSRLDRLLLDHAADLARVRSADDILSAGDQGRTGVISNLQNAEWVAPDLGRVDLLHRAGLRILQLTYNMAGPIGGGAMDPANSGLSDLGHRLVERLNTVRVMIDLAHSGERTCLDAIRASRTPVIISHSGCRALSDLPRNTSDEQLRLLAQRGGLIGIYFMPYLARDMRATAEHVVRHIEHAINICGEDHVAVGTDGPVTAIDDLEAYRGELAAVVEERRRTGIAAAGERSDTMPFILDLRGPDQYRELARRLRRRGHGRTRVEKILGANALRLAREIW
jgi:membrane dipeptidase